MTDWTADWVSAGIALLALLVSGLSIYLTWATLHAQRVHNRLSVRPVPFCRQRDRKDMLFVRIENNGVGPLLIKSISFDDGIASERDITSWIKRDQERKLYPKFTVLSNESSVPTGQFVELIELSGSPSEVDFSEYLNEVREVLSKLNIHLEYTDIYGSEFPAFREDLTFFKRLRR